MPKQPQDHKKKAQRFTFVGDDGETYTLPFPSVGKSKMSGRDYRDAVMGGETGQSALMFKILEASKPAPEALTALYAMQGDRMLDVLRAWGDHGDGDGASLGE